MASLLKANIAVQISYFVQKLYLPFKPGKIGRKGSEGGLIVLTMSASPTAHEPNTTRATNASAKDMFTTTIDMAAGSQANRI
jgi:hypothetical protein